MAAIDVSASLVACRRRKTAAERRSQRARASARAVSHILAGFVEVEAHRGNAVSKAASTFVLALRLLQDGGKAQKKYKEHAEQGADEGVAATPSTAAWHAPGDGQELAASSAASPSAVVALGAEEPLPTKEGKGCADKVAPVLVMPIVVPGDDKCFRVTTVEGDYDGKEEATRRAAATSSSAAAASSLSSSSVTAIEVFDDVLGAQVGDPIMTEKVETAASASTACAADIYCNAVSSSAASTSGARHVFEKALVAGDDLGVPAPVSAPDEVSKKVVEVTKTIHEGCSGPSVTMAGNTSADGKAARSFIGLFGGEAAEHTATVSDVQLVLDIQRVQAESDAWRVMASVPSSVWSSQPSLLIEEFVQLRVFLDGACELEHLGAVQMAIGRFDGSPLSRFAVEELQAIRRVAGRGCEVDTMAYKKLLGLLRKASRTLWTSHQDADSWRECFLSNKAD
jgi:hypothetical protein